MEAVIVEVMESWPLQLRLRDAGGVERIVDLEEDAVVERAGAALDPNALRPGMTVTAVVKDGVALRVTLAP